MFLVSPAMHEETKLNKARYSLKECTIYFWVCGESEKKEIMKFEMDFKNCWISTRRDHGKTILNNGCNMIICNCTYWKKSK